MKIPLIWLKDYVTTDKSAKDIAASFTQLGLMLDKPLDDTNVLDLEHRMDRSDWLSILGCARDLAAFEGIKLNYPKVSVKPGMPIPNAEKIDIHIDTPVVHRFQTRIIKGIKIGKSPSWLVERLKAYGMDSINNIVDITNFVMVEYGQPMHAQDIAKLPGMDISIRKAKKGEKLKTILGTEIDLIGDTHILTSGTVPTVILGVVGGKQTSVSDSTQDIVLDAGNYDSRIIRKSSRQLKIMNETVSRDDKFLDPRLIDLALDRATSLILEIAGGTHYTNDDYYPSPITPKDMTLRLSRLKLLSGMDLDLGRAKSILEALEYKILDESIETLTVEIPYFRTDIEVEDDLISDILRIHNYQSIPVIALSTPVPIDITPSIYKFEEKLRDLLVAQGGHEHITSSLTTSNGQSDEVVLANALSSDQNALRRSLEPGLAHVASTYKKHQLSNSLLFEIGKVFRKNDSTYLEGRLLTVMSDSDSLATLFASLGITNYLINEKHEIMIDAKVVGNMSQSGYTLVTDALQPHYTPYTGIISEFNHTSSLDLSLLVRSDLNYANILTALSQIKGEWVSIACKSTTKMNEKTNNYLITVTWPGESRSIKSDKDLVLKTLKEKLEIDSKS